MRVVRHCLNLFFQFDKLYPWTLKNSTRNAFTLGFTVKTAVILLKSISEFVFNRARSTLYRARWRTFIELPTMHDNVFHVA